MSVQLNFKIYHSKISLKMSVSLLQVYSCLKTKVEFIMIFDKLMGNYF